MSWYTMATSDDSGSTSKFEPQQEELTEIWDTINQLDEQADNEAVDQLLEILVHLMDENHRHRQRITRLEDRLKQVERHVGVTQEDELTVDSPHFDRRDESVLAVLAEDNPDTVSPSRLQTIYRKTTDIRNKATLRERIKDLVNHGPLEQVSNSNRFKYVGE